MLIVRGWISKKEFIKLNYKKDLGHGEGFMVDQDSLNEPASLWKHIMTARFS